MDSNLLVGGNLIFLAGVAGLALVAVRTPRTGSANRRLELFGVLIVAGVGVLGFGLADMGMNFSWSGRVLLSGFDWLTLAGAFAVAVLASHALLRAQQSAIDQAILPAAAMLALLGLLTVYTWEVRDANAYITSEALPAMRQHVAEALKDPSLSADAGEELRAIQRSLPSELEYELDPGNRSGHKYATVLNSNWLGLYNSAARRFQSYAEDHTVELPGGEGRPPRAREVALYESTHRQLAATVLAILFIPFVTWLFRPPRLAALLGRLGYLSSGALIFAVAALGLGFAAGGVPSLPVVGVGGLNAYEILKVLLVVYLTSAFACLRRGLDRRDRRLLLPLSAGVGLALLAFAARDLGAGLVLGLLAIAMMMLAIGWRWRTVLLLGSAVGVVALPVTLYFAGTVLSSSTPTRLQAWTDPWGILEDARTENLANSALRRVVGRRLDEAYDGVERRKGAAAGAAIVPLVRNDVDHVLQELDWRLSVLESATEEGAEPFVPAPDRTEESLLSEAEYIWYALGGHERTYAELSAEELDSLHQGLERTREAFSSGLEELLRTEAAIQRGQADGVGRDGSLAGLDRTRDTYLSAVTPRPDNFQLLRGSLALKAGGLLGVGLGQGRPEAIPAVTEDAAFAAIGETLGLAGSTLVIVLLVSIVWRGIAASGHGRPGGSDVLGVGFSMLIGFQAFVALEGLLGLMPYTGISFPFISRSGTSLITNFCMIAVVAAAGVQGQDEPRRSAEPAPRVGWSSAPLRGAGFPAAFSFIWLGLLVLQAFRRSPSPASFLSATPRGAAGNVDQWASPAVRAVPGSILDRHGRVLAESRRVGEGRVAPDPDLAASIGHVVQSLDLSLGPRMRRADDAPSGSV